MLLSLSPKHFLNKQKTRLRAQRGVLKYKAFWWKSKCLQHTAFANTAKKQTMLLRGLCEHLFVGYNSAGARGIYTAAYVVIHYIIFIKKTTLF